jgi:type II secretory pathway pseudopilin PulG
MVNRFKIQRKLSEKGFTLIEALVVVGLTTMISVGIIAALLEGLDTLHTITDTQSVEFGHQRAMTMFIDDVQAAKWFYNGTQTHGDGSTVLRDTMAPFELTLGYPGSGGDEIWVRYSIQYGAFTRETYLLRTVMTKSGLNQGTTIVTSGVANLFFNYFDEGGTFTDKISEVWRIQMVLSVNFGGTTQQREYDVSMRNTNEGVGVPPGDFDDFETLFFKK